MCSIGWRGLGTLPISASAMSSSSQSKKRTWERRAEDAKKRHRPSLKNWSRDGFSFTRDCDFKALRTLDKGLNTNVPKLSCSELSVGAFRKRFEAPNLPCIITDIPAHESWSATKSWNFDDLKRKYGDHLFKCGEDDDGYKIKMKLKYYLQYLANNRDDSPLYIFDSNFYEQADTKSMMSDFCVPSYFNEDLFSLVGEKRRPPYRWFLVGPERSGTTVHLDPLGTSAWNTLISGRKRWVLFPPEVTKRIAKGQDVLQKGEDDESINYFVDLLPRTRKAHPELQILECIQEPGETIYVPGGWWHGVINLDDTIAITQVRPSRSDRDGIANIDPDCVPVMRSQNFCSSLNFDAVWRETRSGRKKLAVSWLRKLRQTQPKLADRADELNTADEFLMYDELKRKGLVKKKKAKKDKDGKDMKKKEKVEESSLSSEPIKLSKKQSCDNITDCEDRVSDDGASRKKRKICCV